MKILLNKVGVVLLAVFASTLLADTYQVQSGDTLGSIASVQLTEPKPLYGKDGRIHALIKANPHIKNPDLILAGVVLTVPYENRHSSLAVRLPAENVEKEEDSFRNGSIEREVTKPITPQSQKPEASTPSINNTDSNSSYGDELRVSINLSPLFMRMRSTDRSTGAGATLISDLVTLLELQISQIFFKRHEIEFGFSIQQNKYEKPSTGQSLGKSQATKGVDVLYRYWLSRRLALGAGGGITQRLYPFAVSAAGYEFEAPQVGFWQGDITLLLAQSKRVDFGLGYNYRSLHRSSISNQEIKTGKSQRVEIFLKQRRKSFEITEKLFWNQTEQDSSLVNQRETQIGLRVGFSYTF